MTEIDIDEPGGPYRVHGLDDGQLAEVRGRFGPRARAPAGTPRASVRLRCRHSARVAPPQEWSFALHTDARGVDAVSDGVVLRIERAPLSAHAVVEHDDDVLTAITNSVRWLMAYAVLHDGGLLLHSAGLLERDGGAWLLAAPSGTGKSTLCARHEAAGLAVLSDDLNVAWVDALVAEGTSRAEHPTARQRAPLRGVGALLRGDEVSVKAASRARALARLFAASPYVNTDPVTVDACVARCAELVERARVMDVHMTLDDDAHALALRALEAS